MDCRHGRRNGGRSVDFTWDGNDEADRASGRRRVILRQDGSMTGRICFHDGNHSSFKAMPFDDDKPSPGSSPKTERRLR